MVDDAAGDLGADQHTDAVGDQCQESLCAGSNRTGCGVVYVDLAGYKEESESHALQEYADVIHEDESLRVAESEQQVAHEPRQHA